MLKYRILYGITIGNQKIQTRVTFARSILRPFFSFLTTFFVAGDYMKKNLDGKVCGYILAAIAKCCRNTASKMKLSTKSK